eukprot:GHVT01072630.1.p6 GENE.GHVT01072630.1~~GHVT01072630.1.p6  ORF type:complete len:109 (-),score=33.87 GHVT01072630.1:1571-1897(-)
MCRARLGALLDASKFLHATTAKSVSPAPGSAAVGARARVGGRAATAGKTSGAGKAAAAKPPEGGPTADELKAKGAEIMNSLAGLVNEEFKTHSPFVLYAALLDIQGTT